MNENVTRADIHIGILRTLINSDSSHPTTKKLAQFILDNYNEEDEVDTLASFLYICQKIFGGDIETLSKMNMVVLMNLSAKQDSA